MHNMGWKELVKLDYIVDNAQRLLNEFRVAGALFYCSKRYQVMYLHGRVTDLTRKSDVIDAIEIHLRLTNLWCDREIAANICLQSEVLCKPLPEYWATMMDYQRHQQSLPKSLKQRIKYAIENGQIAQGV